MVNITGTTDTLPTIMSSPLPSPVDDQLTAQPAIVVSSSSDDLPRQEHPRDHHMLSHLNSVYSYPSNELSDADTKMRIRRASMCLIETVPPSEAIIDPMCDPKKPRKITFEDVSAAFFVIKDNIRETPCTVNTKSIKLALRLWLLQSWSLRR